MATSRRVGNYAISAKAVTQASDQIFDAAMSSKPDFTKISKEAIKGRSLERRAVTQAEGEVASAGLKAFTDVNLTRMKEDTKKEVRDIMRPAKRMAGAVAGLGAIASGYVTMENNKKDKADRDAFKAEQNAVLAAQEQMTAGYKAQVNELMSQLSNGIGSSTTPTTPTTPTASNTSATPSALPAGENSSTPTSSGSSNPRMSYMQKLTAQGMTPVQAAATVGHLIVETGNFKYMEELKPNRHGTKGYGHLQWTDPKPGKGRRTDFMNWSAQNKLKPSSMEANQGFLVHELTTNFNGSWTGGGNFEGFKVTNTMESSSDYLRNHYIRPSAGSEQRRINEGYRVLDEWKKFNSSK